MLGDLNGLGGLNGLADAWNLVREIAETQKQSAATGIIYGLALGYLPCIVPMVCLGVTISIAHLALGYLSCIVPVVCLGVTILIAHTLT